ncbi:MAG: hypothetical protein DHS20C12_06840 [Pseudohongiella sp.]|nr:MAG: hypothetical protein DHS20C12_06840 [Pseudohongiella sp.]
MKIVTNTYKLLAISTLLLSLVACAAPAPYKAYFGDPRQDMQLSTVRGASFVRTDLLNRYIDTIRFIEVDEIPVTNSDQHRSIQITPGFHDIKVYFSWDLGSLRGLAPAMVDYSKTREDISRTLRFNARAGETYLVMANPVFNDSRHDITTLSHVDFWVEDEDGIEIVSKEDGRYQGQ